MPCMSYAFEFSDQHAIHNQTFQWLLGENSGSSSKLESDTCPGTDSKSCIPDPYVKVWIFGKCTHWHASAETQGTTELEHSSRFSTYKFINYSYTIVDYIF